MRRFATWREQAALARAAKERHLYETAWTGLDMDEALRFEVRALKRAASWRRLSHA